MKKSEYPAFEIIKPNNRDYFVQSDNSDSNVLKILEIKLEVKMIEGSGVLSRNFSLNNFDDITSELIKESKDGFIKDIVFSDPVLTNNITILNVEDDWLEAEIIAGVIFGVMMLNSSIKAFNKIPNMNCSKYREDVFYVDKSSIFTVDNQGQQMIRLSDILFDFNVPELQYIIDEKRNKSKKEPGSFSDQRLKIFFKRLHFFFLIDIEDGKGRHNPKVIFERNRPNKTEEEIEIMKIKSRYNKIRSSEQVRIENDVKESQKNREMNIIKISTISGAITFIADRIVIFENSYYSFLTQTAVYITAILSLGFIAKIFKYYVRELRRNSNSNYRDNLEETARKRTKLEIYDYIDTNHILLTSDIDRIINDMEKKFQQERLEQSKYDLDESDLKIKILTDVRAFIFVLMFVLLFILVIDVIYYCY